MNKLWAAFNRLKDRHTKTVHAVLFLPVGMMGAFYEDATGSAWGWHLVTGTLLAAAMVSAQEWADDRASKAISAHHAAQGQYRVLDVGVTTVGAGAKRMAVAATARQAPEVWHGWDWQDWLGCTMGGLLGAGLTLLW